MLILILYKCDVGANITFYHEVSNFAEQVFNGSRYI